MSGLRYNRPVARICIIPKATNTGGVTSFQAKLSAGLAVRGIQTCYNLGEKPYDAVLTTGGIRDLARLWRARRDGVRIVQRLDGINWLHRLSSHRHAALPASGIRQPATGAAASPLFQPNCLSVRVRTRLVEGTFWPGAHPIFSRA